MSGYWLSISIGPVQGFIAAAGRTRDLWYGSWLLSEVSKAAAYALQEGGATIVLPSLTSEADLQAGNELSVTNKLLVKVPDHKNPEQVFKVAEQAARDRLQEEADRVLQGIKGYIDQERWQRQIDDFLEIYAAWVPDSGAESRRQVERLLAGRKALRNFSSGQGEARVPKSSLDGMRESVLRSLHRPLSDDNLRRLGLRGAEQLDAIGFIKRLGQGRRQYPSMARVAADPWLRRINQCEEKRSQLLADLSQYANKVEGLQPLQDQQYAHFPYEAIICYRYSLEEMYPEDENGTIRKQVSRILANLEKTFGKPSPYFAVLSADGDRIGAIIGSLETAEEIQRLSSAMSKFAYQSRLIVKEHYGAPIYTGGDDVLAFLPLDQVFQCAHKLQDTFNQLLAPIVPNCNPTLSVGISINHFMDQLTDILVRGRMALTLAKEPDRNGLAVALHKRSGADVLQVRYRWDDNPQETIESWYNLFIEKRVAAKAAYELYKLAMTYPEQSRRGEWGFDALYSDAVRVMSRKEITDEEAREESLRLLFENVETTNAFRRNIATMLLAEQLTQISS